MPPWAFHRRVVPRAGRGGGGVSIPNKRRSHGGKASVKKSDDCGKEIGRFVCSLRDLIFMEGDLSFEQWFPCLIYVPLIWGASL